ncbi:MAG: hypothetical protein S4CHLAM37_01140 [Chlamydiia bacterium]|nr:hypothetical protein [Chlamydiia bacterium]
MSAFSTPVAHITAMQKYLTNNQFGSIADYCDDTSQLVHRDKKAIGREKILHELEHLFGNSSIKVAKAWETYKSETYTVSLVKHIRHRTYVHIDISTHGEERVPNYSFNFIFTRSRESVDTIQDSRLVSLTITKPT